MTTRSGTKESGRRHRLRGGPIVLVLAVAALLLVAAGPAAAATVSGSVKKAKGYQVVVVQANGIAKKATLKNAAGRFAVRGVRVGNATVHLVKPDGSYFGPVVLKAAGRRSYATIKGSASLRLGTVTLKKKAGYALVRKVRLARVQRAPARTVAAVRGKPVGAGKLGRVRTGTPQGYRGPGGDLDRDGIVGAFDIDDNGNLILDNVDRTGRGDRRPQARGAVVTARSAAAAAALEQAVGQDAVAPMLRDDPPPAPAPEQPPSPQAPGAESNEFHLFSNFKLTDATSINVSIPGIADVDALIARELPRTITLATQIVGGSTATLDGLGNSYLRPHAVGGVDYPRMNGGAATYSGTSLTLAMISGGVDAQIQPGALPAEIGAGDSFIETVAGVGYPGTLNFVFNTAPALKSYRFDTDATATDVSYDAQGVSSQGMTPAARLEVPSGATSVTLTWWRPQRKASAGETGNADGWIDIGGLQYNADIPNAARAFDGGPELPGTHDARGAYTAAGANGVAVATSSSDEGVLDPARDAPTAAANTVSFTVSFPVCFSEWASFGSGTVFDFDIQARSVYGDNAARKVYFVLE